jgi:hypothetical protein
MEAIFKAALQGSLKEGKSLFPDSAGELIKAHYLGDGRNPGKHVFTEDIHGWRKTNRVIQRTDRDYAFSGNFFVQIINRSSTFPAKMFFDIVRYLINSQLVSAGYDFTFLLIDKDDGRKCRTGHLSATIAMAVGHHFDF